MSESEKKLTILGHLYELRRRLTWSLIVVAVATGIAFFFADYILELLIHPVGNINLTFIELTEMIGTYMRVAIGTALVVAMPYLTYHLIMFVSPALTAREKKSIYLILPWIALMFIGGVFFAYYVLIPLTISFLIDFGSDIASPEIRISNYVSVVTRLLVVAGLVFELPVVTTFLSRLGIVTPKWLASKRKIMFIMSFVLAAIITPTIDPMTQSFVAVPLILLYEMSIWLSKLVYKRKKAVSTDFSNDEPAHGF